MDAGCPSLRDAETRAQQSRCTSQGDSIALADLSITKDYYT